MSSGVASRGTLEELVVVGHQPSVSRWQRRWLTTATAAMRLRVVHAGRAEHADRAGRLTLDLVRGHDERALGQRGHARLGADGHLQAPVEHVAQQRDDDVLLLEDAEHLAHGVDGVERAGDAGGPPDEHLVGVLAAIGPQGAQGRSHRRSVAGSPVAGSVGSGRARRSGEPGGEVGRGRADAPRRRAAAAAPPSPSSRVCFSTPPLDSTSTTRADARREAHDLHRAHGGLRRGRTDDDRRVVGQVDRAGARCPAASARARRGPGRRTSAPAGRRPRSSGGRVRWCRRRSGTPSRWGCGRRWCAAGAGSPPARGTPCRCAPSPRRPARRARARRARTPPAARCRCTPPRRPGGWRPCVRRAWVRAAGGWHSMLPSASPQRWSDAGQGATASHGGARPGGGGPPPAPRRGRPSARGYPSGEPRRIDARAGAGSRSDAPASSGTHRRTYIAIGSKRSPWADGVEDPEVGRGVGARPGHPLPPCWFEARSPSTSWSHEPPGSAPPVEVQVLHEEAGRDHPHPVVHPALGPELAHPGVDDRVAGAALAPRREARRRRRAGVHRPSTPCG